MFSLKYKLFQKKWCLWEHNLRTHISFETVIALLQQFLGHKSDGCSMQIIHYWQWHKSNMGPRCWRHHQENSGDDGIYELYMDSICGVHYWGIKSVALWQDCVCLYQEYESCFQRTKKQIMERPGKRSFEVSEMQIFSKFKAFCKQVEKVQSRILFLILKV